ncbi:Lysophospholipase L1 [Abditibacterium utsteinense]|uniref:Lysophospholipase L1 n=1 Tax=Abditibacterium utsteinense TaxID=1960156 RepID=A0A2S8SRF3_9BACT|nr:GDSL-type esterase/lipase family protein [Abditibacterium utsteinense]PQV63329.1 Lysophospholipase L1 [Abditibacterium utsteinense]
MNSTRISSFLRSALLCGGIAFLVGAQTARADFALKANDRVVFYGDSITDQRLYTTFVETYALTRFPKMPLSFVHSGWGGDRVTGGGGGPIDRRLQRDVLAYHPDVVTLMLGMNDGSYRSFDQGIFNTYSAGINHIIDTVQQGAPGVRITLIEPSPFDDVTRAPNFEGGYNAVLQRFGTFLKDTANQKNLGVADLNAPVMAMLTRANATDKGVAQKILPDRIHPGPGGHLIMAEALLKAWGAPSLVSDVAIDAKSKKVVRAQNTQVSGLQSSKTPAGATLSWTQNDAALPFPLDTSDAAVDLAVKSSDFVEALNREPLQVTGLAAPRYTLSIDGEEIGDFSRQELAQGINLALLPTPMRDQARGVHKLTLQHNDEHFARWRTIQVPFESHSAAVQSALPPLLQALDVEEAQTVAKQRAAAQPKSHRFELSVTARPPVGPNLALHKPYSSTDPNVYGYGTGGLTDGSWSGEQPHTFASGELSTFPKATTIDLGAATSVSQVQIGVPAFGSTKTIRVSLSADGENFTEVGSHVFPLAVERRHRFIFKPVSARYVRLSYPDHYEENAGYVPNFVFTTEAEVYAPAP